MVRDPFDVTEEIFVSGGFIPPGMVTSSSVLAERKTRRRGNKIDVNGEIREVLELSKEELAQWFNERLPIYYEILHEMVTSGDTPKPVKVKLLELITKITGQITEKHEITVINPEDIARRGIEATKELESFKIKLIEGNGEVNTDNA